MEISILRLGHRLPRDERITTHVALVARAFGAMQMAYSGQKDSGLESSVSRLVSSWGGAFIVTYEKNYRAYLKNMKKAGFVIIHLTMYGLSLPEALPGLKTQNPKLLIVVGGEAVPPEIFELADFNVSVTSQPHSEVAALAILLDRLQNGKELERDFDNRFKAKLKIAPSEKGKQFVKYADR